jgi:dipeptidyl aminopeptidase/acylaminoacyl peptidase
MSDRYSKGRWKLGGMLLAGSAALAISGSSVVASAQGARCLTIDEIASAPFPYDLVAAPQGGAVAWIYNERGARNIWITEPGATGKYIARRLTNYTADDGIDINGLSWAGNGKTLFYTRGGNAGGQEAVNPMSLPSGPKAGDIWFVSVDGGRPIRVGEGQGASPSPRSDIVVFLRRNQPFWIDDSHPGKPVQLFYDWGQVSDLSWSPDGTRLAFVSNRSHHSIIGVYDFPTKTIRWLSPGIDKDREPVWSPDGQQIAFLRLPSDSGDRQYVSDREGYPWEIWVANSKTGEGRRIWQANRGVGSRFRELFNSSNSLFWTAGNRLVFPWEVTGWVRLYSLPFSGGMPSLLTPGQSEIFGAELNRTRTQLVYSSNQGDIDRRHIWQLATEGGSPHQLTTSQGVEDFPVITADDHVFGLRGEARSPMRPVMVVGKQMVDLAPSMMPPNFPSAGLVEPQLITFEAADGRVVHGQLFVPKGRKSKGPALLFFHGGPTNRQAFASWDPFETHTHLYEANQYLANHGYIVLSVNYRGGAGYGFEFREPPTFGAGGSNELNDIIGAANYIISRSDIDPERLGIWGGSYGGRMTSLALASAPQYFAAGVDYAGISNWVKMPGFFAPDEAAAKTAFESSPMAHMRSWRAPVLLMHGDADTNVPIEQTTDLATALRDKGVAVDYLMIPDEVHFLLRHKSWNVISDATRGYFDRQLKPSGSCRIGL